MERQATTERFLPPKNMGPPGGVQACRGRYGGASRPDSAPHGRLPWPGLVQPEPPNGRGASGG